MNYKFIIIFSLIFILLTLIICNKEKFSSNDKQNIMTNKKYFNHFNKLDFKLRKIKNYNGIDKFYINGIIEINKEEKKMLEVMTMNFKELLGHNFFKIFENIEFIKVKNHIENSLPHTREKKIILSENWFDTYYYKYSKNKNFINHDKYLQRLIAHEQFHIFQRFNPHLINKLYKDYWNMEKYNDKLPIEILNINRTNPDALPDQNWLFRIDTYNFILPLCVYDSNPTSISDTSNIYIEVIKKNNKFLIINLDDQLKNRKLLINNKKFKEYFGEESANNYHPNELSSSLFEIIVSDQISFNKSSLVMEKIKNKRNIAYKKMKTFLEDYDLI